MEKFIFKAGIVWDSESRFLVVDLSDYGEVEVMYGAHLRMNNGKDFKCKNARPCVDISND